MNDMARIEAGKSRVAIVASQTGTFNTLLERKAARELDLRLKLKRLAKALLDWERAVGSSDESFFELRATDIAAHVFESDFSDELTALCQEVGCDAEGFALDSEGFRTNADRVFIPTGEA